MAPVIHIRADHRFPDHPLSSLWNARELLLLLTRREIHLRYQHSVAGIGWAVLQPSLTIVVLAGFRMVMGHPTSGGMPYPLYAAMALIPWTFFVHALTSASHSLWKHATVINKVHFPRLVLPLSTVMAATADFGISLVVLPPLLIYYRVPVRWPMLAYPVFALLVIVLAAGLGIWLAVLNALFRDVANALPFITQLWFFLTPIAYTASMIPARWQYAMGLNPMTGILEGFRWSLSGSADPRFGTWLLLSFLFTMAVLVSGILFFLDFEERLADVL